MDTHGNSWLEKLIDTCINQLRNDVIKSKIKLLILEPFLQYFIDIIFPYLILLCAIVVVMIMLMVSILVVLLYNRGGQQVAIIS